MDAAVWMWFVATLRAYPELAVFLALAVGFAVGPWKLGGFTLGNVMGTLLAGVLIGQLGITVEGPIKSVFLLMFLFAAGFGVGPQFFRGLGKDGPRQIVFSLVVLALCLIVPVICALSAGLDVGYAAGLYAGSQTISAAIGVATDQIDRLGLPSEEANAVPIGYAVTYLFGTIGSAIVLARLGPKLIGVNLPTACAEYERQMGGGTDGLDPGEFSAYRAIELRAYRIDEHSSLAGPEVRKLFPGEPVFVERLRRGPGFIDAYSDTVLCAGDVVAISGPRQTLIERVQVLAPEVHDAELLAMPATLVDVFVTSKVHSGKTLRALADEPFARGVQLRKVTRQMVEMPILPDLEILRGDVLTLAGSPRHVEAAVQAFGVADRPLKSTDLLTVAVGILIGALIGAVSVTWRGVPIGLSTSGGALLAGLTLGYFRTAQPAFGRIPAPALVLMNTLGLNVFIAIVGINAGPEFVAGIQEVGLRLLLWGAMATTVPLVLAILLGHHVFKFHPAILFGLCAGVRTTTAALGMIQDAARSRIPALGYGMPYAIGNTLLTIFAIAIVLLTSR